jgi:hypothetical protein
VIINIPIHDLKKPPALKFPDYCVNCGRPKETTLGISLNMGVQVKGQVVTMKLTVPMCNVCAEKERSIAKVTLIPFMIAGFIIGIIVFVPVALIAPEGTMPQTVGFPFVLGGFAGLIAGILGGSIVEFLVKILAVPFYGKLLARRPLTILGFLMESDQLIGISARFLREPKIVQLEFENEKTAREFTQLNPLEKK